MQKNITIKAFVALFILTLIWGYNWVVMKLAVQYASPFQFAAMRTFSGAIILFIVMLFTKRSLAVKEFPTMLVLGLLQTIGFTGLIIWAVASGSAGKTAVLSYTMPFWVMLFAWPLLGEKAVSYTHLDVYKRQVLTIDVGVGTAEDPYFKFNFVPKEAGKFEVKATDNEGKEFTQGVDVKV